ncbi:MAG: tail fiber domain-containing protein [Bacteroidales bacterium]|nr:tail fiber domain-containing protein [Bacteroidales bacterium]
MKKQFLITFVLMAMIYMPSIAQVAINTSGANPNASAGLDVDFTNKGVLIPRVALTQTTTASPITSPATSLLVYNTATQNDVTPGYYYWNGSQWVRIAGNGTCNIANYILKSNGMDATCSQIFDNGTNVGIGTASPSAKLEVVGSVYANNGLVRSTSNSWANHDIRVASISEHPAFVGLRGRGTIASPAYPQSNDPLLSLTGRDMIDGYSGYGGNIDAYGGAAIDFRASENFSGTNKGAFISFITTQSGTNLPIEKMRLTDAGNLGIGTTLPNARIEILGSNNAEFIRLNNSTTPPFQIFFGNNLGNVSNPQGVVYFDVIGTETYVMGGHVVPDVNMSRDLGSSPNHMWNYLYCYDVYVASLGGYLYNLWYSDKRLKKDIEPITNALSNILKLKPVKFNWKADEFSDKHFDRRRHIGLIAQEVEEVYPEIVNTNDEGFKSIDYSKLTPVLIKAVQELNSKIEQLEKENKEMKKKLNIE